VLFLFESEILLEVEVLVKDGGGVFKVCLVLGPGLIKVRVKDRGGEEEVSQDNL